MNREVVIRLKKRHVNQQHIITTAKRFNVLKCGRRFGKTSLAEELIIEPALDGFPVAYYAPTYKDLDEFWQVIKQITFDAIAHKNEQLKQLRFITGGVIDMWSLDDPNSGRGRKYKRVVIDECEKASKLKDAWNGTIRATLTDFIGDAWFLSTPQFGLTYFKQLFKRHSEQKFEDEWQAWRFSTYDNPYIQHSEIDSAKNSLDPMYFACEYLAEDVTLNAMRWAFAYDEEKHVIDDLQINPHLPIVLSFDFNRNPICCSVLQANEPGNIDVFETIKLPNSDIYELCEVIKSKYGNKLFIVTGDASGKSSSALVKDNLNYYIAIRQQLNLTNNQIMVPSVNPPLEDNRMLVNSLLSRGNVRLHRTGTKGLQFDLENVAVSEDGKIKKDNRSDITQQADALDTFRYACNVFLKNFLTIS
jgi:hypothetical protein